ncbi:hypothetical protein JW933_08075 [candidate division FCPU426 bacterium]|nr:hypothetical protein [candidate division FCPU426 bacterium]
MAGPAEVLFHSTNEDEIDINIIRVDNMGLGKKAHLLLIVLSKHAHKKHGCQARAAAFGNEGFEEEAEALKAAELFVEAACIKPKATLTATATLTNTSTPLATATPTMTIIPTDTATPTPVAVPVMDGKIIAYPQPARDLVRFALATPEAAWVKLEVYNLAGEKVAEVAEYKTAAPWGTFVEWRCRQAAPGFYLCRIDIRGDDGSRRQISLKIAVAH